jgi:hypothetical protein
MTMLCAGTDAAIGWPATHDVMLAVGNNELNYSGHFCMSCLKKIICKIRQLK